MIYQHIVDQMNHEQLEAFNRMVPLMHECGFMDMVLDESDRNLKSAAVRATYDSESALKLQEAARLFTIILGISESLRPRK